MTDIVKGFTVTLTRELKDYDFDVIMNAVKMIKGVEDVKPIIDDSSEYITLMKRDREIREKLYDFIKENL